MSEPTPDDGLYDFAEPSPAKPPARKVSKPQAVADPDAPAVLPNGAVVDDKSKPAETDQIKNVYLPLGLLCGGVFVEMLSAVVWSHHVAGDFAEIAVDLTLGTGIMLVAMLIAARLRQIDLGKLGVAAYKLAAISIAPAAMMAFLTPIVRFIPFGIIVCWIAEFAFFFALLGALFDLDESDTWYCVWTIFITKVGIYLVLRSFFHG